jgi:bifunctional non-homologous end joining protein LigD
MAQDEAIEIGGVRLTSPDKVLYPEQGITKRALAQYHLAVAEWMLPHLAGRPMTLVRCPTGRQKKCFYQRHAGSGVPGELKEVAVPGFEESGAYLYIEDAAGLVALVQMGVLEVHPWGVRVDRPDRPDRVIFDLDPGEGLSFDDVVAAALELRERLAAAGMTSFAKTTGGKGIHVVAPLERRYEWKEVKGFAKAFAEAMAKDAPDRFLTRAALAERPGKIFIDYLRNDATATAVAPYSTRARPGAPVAMPVHWSEVKPGLGSKAFTIESVPARLKKRGDAWKDMANAAQRLPGRR